MAQDTISKTLQKLNYGIYIVTSRKDGDELATRNSDWVSASTISWASQVSMSPDLLAVAVQRDSNLSETIQKSGNFALHILAEGDREHVKDFDGPADFSEEQVNGYEFSKGESGAPILKLGLGVIECTLDNTVTLEGDHYLFIGKPVGAELRDPGATSIALEETQFEYGG